MAVGSCSRLGSSVTLGVLALCLGWSLVSVAAELPSRLVVRSPSGQTIETLTATPGGGYVRRSARGEWLGRATLLGSNYRFVDQAGRTVATARPEVAPLGVGQRPLAQKPLAVVRDTHGEVAGTISAAAQ
jgi:hypothetical protein